MCNVNCVQRSAVDLTGHTVLHRLYRMCHFVSSISLKFSAAAPLGSTSTDLHIAMQPFRLTGFKSPPFIHLRSPVFPHFSSLHGMSSSDDINSSLPETRNPRWEALWTSGVARGQFFDTGSTSPALLKLLAEDQIPNGRALVPGCGRGYDVITLASANRKAVGLEIAPGAVDAARENLMSIPEGERPPEGSAEFQMTNFFDMPTQRNEDKFDFIYDYTFLCALNPSIRDMWAAKMAALVRPGGLLLTLIYPISEDKEDGPPFRVTLEIVRNLLMTVGFEQIQLELLPFELCHPGREGVTGPYASGIGRWRRKQD